MSWPDLVALTGASGQTALEEARRSLQICNACRYCEGYCAVFPAMTRRREFSDGGLVHLANLCHGCRDCFYACQYAPPHDFGINIPKALSDVRLSSYAAASPGPRWLFEKPIRAVVVLIAAMLVLTEFYRRWLGSDPGAKGFYGVIGRDAMIAFGLTAAALSAAGLVAGLSRYLAIVDAGLPGGVALKSWLRALRNAVTLRYLGGGGVGCNDTGETFSSKRRIFHHLMAGGFVSCFAATAIGAIYDHLFGYAAPYPLLSAPGLFGTIGGLGIVAGAGGLWWLKRVEDRSPTQPAMTALDLSLLLLLLGVAASGLAVRAANGTAFLAPLVVVHLATVAALFIAMPLGKFIHAGFRFLALARNAEEERVDIQKRGETNASQV